MKKCITTIYYLVDNFCKIYHDWERSNILPSNKVRNRVGKLTLSELLTILLYFYLSPCQDFKNYYLYLLPHKYRGYFKMISYSRFIQLVPSMLLPLTLLIHCLKGKQTGTYYIDSTKLAICHNKRTGNNKVFKKIAKLGKSSYGWFMGFKLHMIINHRGEIMAVNITKGNRNDVTVAKDLASGLTGKIYGDKGYISKNLFEKLYSKGLALFTSIRKDMKNYLFEAEDKINLRKRSFIETVFKVLKCHQSLEHSRHRSPLNFLVHILACLNAYSLHILPPNPHLIQN